MDRLQAIQVRNRMSRLPFQSHTECRSGIRAAALVGNSRTDPLCGEARSMWENSIYKC